jgi:hypothetical protein
MSVLSACQERTQKVVRIRMEFIQEVPVKTIKTLAVVTMIGAVSLQLGGCAPMILTAAAQSVPPKTAGNWIMQKITGYNTPQEWHAARAKAAEAEAKQQETEAPAQ